MDTERIDRITEWGEESLTGGFDGLRALADRDFSGAVTDGVGWLYLLNGRVVGVSGADLDHFADADGTAYEAPHPSLPLLFAMQERGGEVRAQYYTEDTPLSEADSTLSSGNFTGYVELTENILSGDYYVVYHGGKSLSAAFVGSAEQLKTGDEAFELANDEVGIYEVYDVDLTVREIPDSRDETAPDSGSEPTDADGDGFDAGSLDSGITMQSSDATGAPENETGARPAEGQTDGRSAESEADDGAVGRDSSPPSDSSSSDSPPSDSPPADSSPADSTPPQSSPSPTSTASPNDEEPTPGSASASDDDPGGSDDESDAKAETSGGAEEPGDAIGVIDDADGDRGAPPIDDSPRSGSADGSEGSDPKRTPDDTANGGGSRPDGADGSDVFSREAEWRQAKSIPALDPDESSDEMRNGRTGGKGATGEGGSEIADRQSTGGATADSVDRSDSATAVPDADDADPSAAGADATPTEGASGGGSPDEDVSRRPSVKQNELQRRVQRLESALEETESRRKRLETERDEAVAEREEYEAETERLQSRVSELESEVDRLEDELREARARLPDGERSMSPAAALAETNLFVRYDSQGGATLEGAHEGSVDREAVIDNLRLEHHTSFEAEDVVVDSRPYREFLADTIEYGFTRWVIEDLLYEIRETGNVNAMRDLYDAIPKIDRAEIGGQVSIRREEDGEEHREQRTFDLVLRSRMGNALIAADLNDGRDPTQGGSLESLVEDAGALVASDEGFAAAFAVTASFFEPGALEAVEDATSGGLFARGKQKSYVKLSRKRGYHLCLVETRDGEFHLNVPEL